MVAPAPDSAGSTCPHLAAPATPALASRKPAAWQPVAPAWSARFATRSGQMVAAHFSTEGDAGDHAAHLRRMTEFFAATDGPAHVEHGTHSDRVGRAWIVSIAYWTDPGAYDRWNEASGFDAWWDDPQRLSRRTGHSREVLTIPLGRLESIFGTADPVGAACTGHPIDGPVEEHLYWGSMRDRIPAARADGLASPFGDTLPREGVSDTRGRRVRVTAPENLVLIRSGQDWSRCGEEELDQYDGSVRPALVDGMAYLRDNPDATGCCDMRFASAVTPDGRAQARAFGLGFFLSLRHLERWAEHHPTHLAIFSRFVAMAVQRERLDTRLWHEVMVLPAQGQLFEYVNCHPQTGLLPYFPGQVLEAKTF